MSTDRPSPNRFDAPRRPRSPVEADRKESTPGSSPDGPRRPFPNWLPILAAIGLGLAVQSYFAGRPQGAPVPYSEFEELLARDEVEEVVVQGDVVRARLKTARPDGSTSILARRFDPELARELSDRGVVYSSRPVNDFFARLFSWIAPVALFFGVWFFLMRRMASAGGMGPNGLMSSVGKSKAKVIAENDTKNTFADVAGADEAVEELSEVVEFLRDPRSHGRLGARMPKGVLLVGPPGTGKTLLARAVAGEAAVPFFSISGSEFVEMFVGVGAARVRDLFEQARAQAPCIIFVDELDALGKARSSHPGFGGHDEKEQTLNQLLVELDGFDSRSGIVLLAATNRPEILDPALLRAGRFDRQVLVDRPDRRGREAILEVHLRDVDRTPEVAAAPIAALTAGFTGADLANLVNEAALIATRRRAEKIDLPDFTAAIERVVAGLEKKTRLLSPREREIVAHHEMGHALVAACQAESDPVHKVSIIPRGMGALGYTLQRPTEDRYLATREEMEAKLDVLQGGRAAEFVIYGHYSTGAADDLARATQIARDMVTRFAMVPELGSATYVSDSPGLLGTSPMSSRNHSERTFREIDLAIRTIVDASFERAQEILRRNLEVLRESAAELLSRENLDEADLQPFFDRIVGAEAPESETSPAPESAVAVNA